MARDPLVTLAVLLALCGTTAAAQQPAPPGPDRSLAPYASRDDDARLPDGRTIHMVCMGQGSPTVILTAGAGDWSITWNKVQPEAAKKTRVCAWDRPGFGLSGASSKPPTVDNTTTDLQDALKAGRIKGPYVLVGHSLGGYESVLFADREPKQTAGMVLVDPSFPDQIAVVRRVAPALLKLVDDNPNPLLPLLQKCSAAIKAGRVRYSGPDPDGCLHPPWPPTYPPELKAALDKRTAEARPETMAAIMDTMTFYMSSKLLDVDSKIAVNPHRNYGDMPLIVLTAGEVQSFPTDPDDVKAQSALYQVEWRRAHDAYAALSTRGVNRIVEGSTHYIQQIKPEVVIGAIDEVVDAARTSKGR
jgi:pimeloyl-ACP methyl ester carboxylesterase